MILPSHVLMTHVVPQAEIGPRVLDRTSTIFRAPLEFIKSDRPLLAQEKKESKIKPLTPLANAAAADKDVVWQRVRCLNHGRACVDAQKQSCVQVVCTPMTHSRLH